MMKLITPAMASEPYTAEAPSFRTSTRSIAEKGITDRFTPWTPFTSPAKPFTRWPLMRTRVRPPVRPRRLAVCAEKVVAPMVLLESTLPALALAPISCRSSTALVAPLLSISSREITVTGRELSPSTRLMFEPVTSMRSLDCGALAAGCCANALNPVVPNASAAATAMASLLSLRFMFSPGFEFGFEKLMSVLRSVNGIRPRGGTRVVRAQPRASNQVNSPQNSWNASCLARRRALGEHPVEDADREVRRRDELDQALGAPGQPQRLGRDARLVEREDAVARMHLHPRADLLHGQVESRRGLLRGEASLADRLDRPQALAQVDVPSLIHRCPLRFREFPACP